MEAVQPHQDLIIQQQELENELTMLGVTAFRQKTKGAVGKDIEDRTVYGTALLDSMLP